MYNEFVKNITKENDPVRQKALYNEKTLIGRLHQYFLIYFETFCYCSDSRYLISADTGFITDAACISVRISKHV